MRIQQLRYFVAVVEHGSFTRAAEHLFVAQPSVSQQIQRLEKELGVQLLDRSQRVVVPTEIGERLLQRVQTVLAEITDIEREAADYSGLAFGTLRIGTVPSASRLLLPRALPWFTSEHPNVELEIHEGGSLEIADRVREGDLDLGLVVNAPGEADLLAGFHLRSFAHGEIAACLPSNHALWGRTTVRLEQLRDEPIIEFRRGYLVQHLIERAATWDIRRNVVYSTDNTESARSMVAAGVGITFVSSFSEGLYSGNEDVRVVPVTRPQLRVDLVAITFGDRYLPRTASEFLSGVQRIVESSRSKGPRGTHQITVPDITR